MDLNFKSENEFYKLFPMKLCIGSYGEGYCYRYKNYFIKKFYDMNDLEYSQEELLQFKSFQNETYKFYNGSIIIDGKFSGVIMDYIETKQISSDIMNVSFDSLCLASKKYEYDTLDISKNHILVNDAYYTNILYSVLKNQVFVIDPTNFKFSQLSDISIYNHNIYFLSEAITNLLPIQLFLNILSKSKIINEIIEVKEDYYALWGKIATLKRNVSPLELLKTVRNELENICQTKIDKPKDAILYLKNKKL